MSEVAAEVLSPEAGRLVINRTGLEGPFDFDLDFTPAGASAAAASPDSVPLVTALQNSLDCVCNQGVVPSTWWSSRASSVRRPTNRAAV